MHKFYTILLPQLLFIYSIFVDNLNGYIQYNMGFNSGVGVVFRGIVILFLLPIVFKSPKNWIKNNFYILLVLYMSCIVLWILSGSHILMSLELDRLFKIVYFFLVVSFFYVYRFDFNKDNLLACILNSGFIIGLMNIFCFIMGQGIRSYGDDFGFGTKVFYMDGNSLGLYMTMILGISLWILFYRRSLWVLFKVIVIVIGTLMIGSRVAILGTGLLCVFLSLYYCMRKDELININIYTRRFILCLLMILFFYSIVSVLEYIHTDGFSMERFSLTGILSTREFLIDVGQRVINSYTGLAWFIGKGYSGGMYELAQFFPDSSVLYKGVENDFYSILVSYGFVFGGYMMLFFLQLYYRIFCRSFFVQKNSVGFTFLLVGTLWLGASVIAGHGIYNVMVAPLFGVVYSLSYIYDRKRYISENINCWNRL